MPSMIVERENVYGETKNINLEIEFSYTPGRAAYYDGNTWNPSEPGEFEVTNATLWKGKRSRKLDLCKSSKKTDAYLDSCVSQYLENHEPDDGEPWY